MEKRVCIVNFNTPELVEAAILSLWKHTPDAKVTVFDNSNITPCFSMEGVDVLDNTDGQIIDFEKLIESFPNRKRTKNGYGSAKHCYTVDYCFNLFEDGFVLLDSDVLVKTDISDLFDEKMCWVGQSHTTTKHPVKIPRIYPFCCFINTRLCRKHGVRYFDAGHMWKLSDDEIGGWYDTGAWFLEASKGLPNRQIQVSDYVEHYGAASCENKNWMEWLDEHKELYTD